MARTHGSTAASTDARLRREALRLFARHGFAAVSMRQIAAAVGVQAGALYRYTPDKQALLFDLMQAHMDEVLAAWAGAEPRESPPCARLEAFVRFHIGFHLDRVEAVFVSYMELRNLTPGNFARIEALRRRYEGEVERILRDGIAEGVFDLPDPRLGSLALIAMMTGVTTWYRPQGRLSRARIGDIYWDMARRMVSIRPAAPDPATAAPAP